MSDFTKVAGQAKKGTKVTYFKFVNGKNKFRLVKVGKESIIPRYVYWIKDSKENNINLECLAFDREKEAFTNIERDVVQEKYPDLKCSWSYVSQAIDLNEASETYGEVVALAFKKNMFLELLDLINDHWGDPADPETGVDIVVIRKKTGPHAFNVSYSIDVLGSKQRPLTGEEKEKVANATPLEDLFPRPTPEEQEAFLNRINTPAKEDEEVPQEVASDLEEDAPF